MTATLTRTDDIRLAQPPHRGGTRRRRILRSTAGLGAAAVLAVVGTVMATNANFSERYVSEQLGRQKITFKAADLLTDAERKSDCVVGNAGKPLTTGKQAECFANDFIGVHIPTLANGQTYAEVSDKVMALRPRVAAAQASGDPALPDMQKEMTDLSRQSDTLFKAEMLRGALLTSFGFSELGAKAGQAATIAYGAAGLVALLSIAGLVHAFVKPRTEAAGR